MSLRLRIKENCSAFRRRGRFLTPVQVVMNSETSAWSSIRLLGGSSRAERRGCCTSDSNPAPEERLMHLRAATPPLKRDCCTSGQQPRPATSKTTVSFRGAAVVWAGVPVGRGCGDGAAAARTFRGRASREGQRPVTHSVIPRQEWAVRARGRVVWAGVPAGTMTMSVLMLDTPHSKGAGLLHGAKYSNLP